MKCKRAPYKSYRHSSYENARESSQLNEPAPGPYVIQNPHSSELHLNFQDSVNTAANSPAIPLETPTRQGVPLAPSIQTQRVPNGAEEGELSGYGQ